MIARFRDLTMNRDGSYNMTLTVRGECQALYDQLKDEALDVEVKKHREKRSISANAYAWVLMDQIAERMQKDKLEYYRETVRSIGGVSTVVCVVDKAVEALRRGWESRGIGWQTEVMERPSKLGGTTLVVLYYGSSLYDTKQMSTLISRLVQDAESLGIPTLTEKEVNRMMGAWGNGKEPASR